MSGIAETLTTDAALPPLQCGAAHLDRDERVLRTPRGEIRLQNQHYAVLERMMRRPGVVVSRSDLIAAMYSTSPDNEPDGAEDVLRRRIHELRSSFRLLSIGASIVTERGGDGGWMITAGWGR